MADYDNNTNLNEPDIASIVDRYLNAQSSSDVSERGLAELKEASDKLKEAADYFAAKVNMSSNDLQKIFVARRKAEIDTEKRSIKAQEDADKRAAKRQKNAERQAIQKQKENRQLGRENAWGSFKLKGGLIAGLVGAAARFMWKGAMRGVNYASKESETYAGLGGKGNQKALSITQSLSRLGEAASKTAMSILGLEKEFKSYHEVFAETLAGKSGYTEATLGKAIASTDLYFRSMGILGNSGTFHIGESNIGADMAEVLLTAYTELAKNAGIKDEDLGEHYSSFLNVLKSGSGYDDLFGFSLSDDIMEAAIREMPEYANRGFYSMLSDEDKLMARGKALYKLMAEYSKAEQVVEGSGAQAINNQVAGWKKLGEQIEQAKNQLFAFDEVISYSGKSTFGRTAVDSLYNTDVVMDSEGNMHLVNKKNLSDAGEDLMKFYEDFYKAATSGSLEDIKLNMIALLEYNGYEYEDAKKLADKIYDDTDLSTREKHDMMWTVLMDAGNNQYWTYDELDKAIDDAKLDGSHKIEFKTPGLMNLWAATQWYSKISGIPAKTIEIDLSDGTNRARNAMEQFSIYWNNLTNQQKWEKLKQDWQTLADLVESVMPKGGNVMDFNLIGEARAFLNGGTPGEYSNLTGDQKAALLERFGEDASVRSFFGSHATDEEIWKALGNEVDESGNWHKLETATGGIVSTHQIRSLAEGNRAEAVIPLESQGGIEYLANALNMAGAGGSTEVHVTLNGQILEMNDYNVNRLGQKLGAIIDNANNRRGSQNYAVNK